MGNLINYNAATQNVYNPYASQYSNFVTGATGNTGMSGLGGSAFGGIVSGIMSMAGAGFNYALNSDAWERQNAYNDPRAQMHRLMAAGINPNAIAQGMAGAGSSADQQHPVSVPDIGQSMASGMNATGRAMALDAEIENVKSQTRVNDVTAENLGEDVRRKKASFDTWLQKQVDDGRISKYNADKLRPYAEHADEWYKIDFDKLDQQVEQIRQNIIESKERVKNLEKERDVMTSEIGLNNANAALARAKTTEVNYENIVREALGGADNIETAYVLAKVKGNDKEAKAIKAGVKEYVAAEQEAEQTAVETVKNANDPIRKEQERIRAKYRPEIDRLQAKIDKMLKDHDNFRKAWQRAGFAYQRYLELKRQQRAYEKQMSHELDQIKYHQSGSVKAGPAGVSY